MNAVLTEAASWLRTPWIHHARIKGVGVDCVMLVLEVFERAGVWPHLDPGEYFQDFMLHKDQERLLAFIGPWAHLVDHPEPGDIAVWRVGRVYAHVAIILDWPRIIHADAGQGGVVLDDVSRNPALVGRELLFFRGTP